MRRASGTRRPRELWACLDRGQRGALVTMVLVIVALHAVGFFTLLVLVSPAHAEVGAAGTLTVGTGLTAYTLGLRHAFDADHIAAIDNTTRRLMTEGQRPLTVGFWFSLGHSTIVFVLTFLISLGVRSLDGSIAHGGSNLHQFTNGIGALISGGFLYLIAAVNVVILIGIYKVFREMRRGRYDERTLERQLDSRGLINRLLSQLIKRVATPSRMYPVGLLFGLGFDTATEVALLVLAAGSAGAGLPWYTVLCLPTLFAAGMSLMDSIDGSFMNFAYGWAFAEPVRKVFYNLTVTGLSVAVALVIGTIEIGGLIASGLKLRGAFWGWLQSVNINSLGFVIVGMFLAAWAIAVSVWRLGRIEERWARTIDEEVVPAHRH